MKRPAPNQSGFIPLLVTLLLVIAVVIYLIYSRVLHAQK
jgi:hypothetical protein